MPASDLTVQQITRAGLSPTLVAANVDGNLVSNNGRVFLEVANASVSDITVTIATPGTVDGRSRGSRAVVVEADDTLMIGPFPTRIYNDSSGKLNVSYSDVTTVTVGAFRL